MVPKAAATSAANRSQSATLETSAWKGAARPPASSISFTTASALSRAVCATTATWAPSAPRRRAMAAPIPREPPVTIATLPSSLMTCLSSLRVGDARAPYQAVQPRSIMRWAPCTASASDETR